MRWKYRQRDCPVEARATEKTQPMKEAEPKAQKKGKLPGFVPSSTLQTFSDVSH